jgi:hypothetical protein
MNTIKLQGSEIGRFNDRIKLSNYKKMMSVKDPIESMIQDIVSLDDTNSIHSEYGRDYNFKLPGNVLIDNNGWSGEMEFNPSNKEIKKMVLTHQDTANNIEQFEFTNTEDNQVFKTTNYTRADKTDMAEESLIINKKTGDMELNIDHRFPLSL